MKKVLIIKSSLRSNSNSDALAEAFAKGARGAGHDVKVVSLKEKRLAFCQGCMGCQKAHECVIKDDALPITKAMESCDVIVFATPIYYYGISAQLKTLLDRSNALYTSEYTFRDIYLLLTATENMDKTPIKSILSIEGWTECFEKAHLADTVFAGGVSDAGDITKYGEQALKKAEKMGGEIK